MNTERRILLSILVVTFCVLAGLFVWSQFFDQSTRFQAGTPQTIVEAKAADPTMPPVRPTDPKRGSTKPNAVEIVEFADFTCLYCRMTEAEIEQAVADLKDVDVRLIWRDFPINLDRPESTMTALAARCADDQHQFWQMHDALLRAQAVDVPSLKLLAKQLRLDQSAFDACLSSGKYLPSIGADLVLAKQHGITGAPTIFIGNKVFTEFTKAADIKAAIYRARK